MLPEEFTAGHPLASKLISSLVAPRSTRRVSVRELIESNPASEKRDEKQLVKELEQRVAVLTEDGACDHSCPIKAPTYLSPWSVSVHVLRTEVEVKTNVIREQQAVIESGTDKRHEMQQDLMRSANTIRLLEIRVAQLEAKCGAE